MTKKEINIKNLKLLRDYIRDKVTDEQFDMKVYRANRVGLYMDYYSKYDCGTVGCALGWAPFVKGLEPIEKDFREGGGKELDYDKYSLRLFPPLFDWSFLFSSRWVYHDNTREGFVKRVNHLLNCLLDKDLKLGGDNDSWSYLDFKKGWTKPA